MDGYGYGGGGYGGADPGDYMSQPDAFSPAFSGYADARGGPSRIDIGSLDLNSQSGGVDPADECTGYGQHGGSIRQPPFFGSGASGSAAGRSFWPAGPSRSVPAARGAGSTPRRGGRRGAARGDAAGRAAPPTVRRRGAARGRAVAFDDEDIEEESTANAASQQNAAVMDTSIDDTDSDSSSDVEEEMMTEAMPILLYGMYHGMQHYCKSIRKRGDENAHAFVCRMLSDTHYCYTMFRMRPPLFHQLHRLLVSSYGLQSSTKSSSIEALGMFLWMVGTPQPFRQAETLFGRSLDTVHRNFEKVLYAVDKLAADIIRPVDTEFSTTHPRLLHPKYKGIFNNCIGAIDGTHIPVLVDTDKVVQYLNRKGKTSQNIMAVCDFDLRFTFVLAGWPGSVHDMRVFNDAMENYGDRFPHPPEGKYYLVDSGYPNRVGYLAPYKGTKYHLQEFRLGTMARGMKETFNYAHSSIRNHVERSFGVLKQKWRMLYGVPRYPIAKQTKIITAAMALHNFIRENDAEDVDFNQADTQEDDYPQGDMPDEGYYASNGNYGVEAGDADMHAFRDQLANDLYYGI